MGAKIAKGTGTGDILLQAPDQGEVRIHDPLLEVDRPPVVDTAKASSGDEPTGQLHGGHAPIVEVDHTDNTGAGHGIAHLPRLGERIREGLLTEDMLARLSGSYSDRGVGIAGGRDIDKADRIVSDEAAPVGLIPLPAELCGSTTHGGLVAATERV